MAPDLPPPRKIVTYPIGDDATGGAVFFFGDANAPNLVLTCGGYPDDREHFHRFASRLATEAKCLVGVTCLPGFDNDRPERPYTSFKREGYSFNEWKLAMQESVKVLKAESTFKGKAKLTGLFHDFGCYAANMYTNRIIDEGADELKPDQLIMFDILAPPHDKAENLPDAPKDTFYEKFLTLAYRLVLAVAVFLRLYVWWLLGAIFLMVGFLILAIFGLVPTYATVDGKIFMDLKNPLTPDRMVYMAYPYYYMLLATYVTRNEKEEMYGLSLPLDLTKTPVLYLYGLSKRVHFHDKTSYKMLENEAKAGRKSKIVPVEDAGHYLFVQKEDLCMAEVKKFIEQA